MNYRSQRAVALVVTLIMLSVVTFLAIAFLGLARRERASVLVSGSANDAYNMAVTAMNRALAETVAQMLASTNKADYGLRVSTNFINPLGFLSGQSDPTNVNYVYYTTLATPLSANDALINLGNLLYNPRPPVYVITNTGTGAREFRYYLDFNRNGRFDSNGLLPILTNPPVGYYTVAGVIQSNHFVGDPEWIGVLLYPGQPHGPTNPFVGRFAFLVQPASKCLDLNYVHNRALAASLNPGSQGDYYYRHTGVGTWEANLAGFLVDLNTNQWPGIGGGLYNYLVTPPSSGTAFDDANGLLDYRLNGKWQNLNSFAGMYPSAPAFASVSAGIDFFTDDSPSAAVNKGPMGPYIPNVSEAPALKENINWVGGDNISASAPRFLDMQELFLPRGAYAGAAGRFLSMGTSNSTYGRYAFYRLMDQLGVDSVPQAKRMNVNWTNDITYTNAVWGVPETATGFKDWTPAAFFHNAAHFMLRSSLVTQYVDVALPTAFYPYYPVTNNFFGTNVISFTTSTNYYFGTNLISTNLPPAAFSSTNIAIWPYSEYFPETHRLLQLAANMYDATASRTAVSGYPYCPSVFRPYFQTNVVAVFGSPSVLITNISIAGYVEEAGTNWLSYTNLDLSQPNHVDAILTNGTYAGVSNGVPVVYSFRDNSLVDGLPVIIGAKKGFPNFNEFVMQSVVQATRKLEFVKSNATDVVPWQTNQMLIIGISNRFGVECWNSYASTYPRPLVMFATNTFTYVMTNEFGLVLSNRLVVSSTNAIAAWPGRGVQGQFQFPLFTNSILLTNSVYSTNFPTVFSTAVPPSGLGGFAVAATNTFDRTNGFHVPPLVLNITNHLVYALIDTGVVPARVVDYVNLTNLNGSIDIMKSLVGQTNVLSTNLNAGIFWNTNRVGGASATNYMVPTVGITNQIAVALSTNLAVLAGWRSWSLDTPIVREILRFKYFMGGGVGLGFITNRLGPLQTRMQCPFSPTRKIVQNLSWEVNDPLVHYTTRDITPVTRTNVQAVLNYITPPSASVLPPMSFGLTNQAYRPWGGNPQSTVLNGTEYALWLKDPGVRTSDDWDFPVVKWPNVGWLGRVHRGTPWQTVYMKSTAVNGTNWNQWAHSGDTHPTNDWKLFDLFAAWPNNNAARGLLSVNQTNLAAWSAVLSGVPALTNLVNTNTGPFNNPNYNPPLSPAANWAFAYIAPAGSGPQLQTIYNGIQARRAAVTNFTHVGDILSVPELTVISPYLNLGPNGGTNTLTYEQLHSLSDQMYERIPQMVMGLLTVEDSPRFVVYAWGQALRPAERSLVIAPGPFYNLCTNYQIAAEYAVHAVVRVDNLPTLRQPTNGLPPPRVTVESFRQLPNE